MNGVDHYGSDARGMAMVLLLRMVPGRSAQHLRQ